MDPNPSTDIQNAMAALLRGKASAPTVQNGHPGIDLSRPIIKNGDGSFSTERTITVEADGRHYVIPTIVNGKEYAPDQAVRLWTQGKNQHVGEFGSAQEADAYARNRSAQIGRIRGAEAMGGR